MSEANQDRYSMTDHDLLIRLDERMENQDAKLDKMNNLRGRIIRLETIVGFLAIAGGGAAAGVNLLG